MLACRRDSGYGYGHRGYVFIDPTDFLLIWDPYYSRHSRQRVESGEGMTFVEAVFSFVFGDGDPNISYEVSCVPCGLGRGKGLKVGPGLFAQVSSCTA